MSLFRLFSSLVLEECRTLAFVIGIVVLPRSAREREREKAHANEKRRKDRTKEKRPVRKEIDEKRFSDVRKTASAFGFRASSSFRHQKKNASMTMRSTVFSCIICLCYFNAVHAYGGGGFWQENDVLPLDVLSRTHTPCVRRTKIDLGNGFAENFDFRQNENGHKYVTIIGTYFTGCTPGRLDYPTLTTYLKSLYDTYETEGATAHVAALVSLKNGVNEGACDAWMTHDATSVNVNTMGGKFPLMIDDRDRSLTYSFFDAAVHPQYAVLDHCMRVAKFLPGTADFEGEESLLSVVTKFDVKYFRKL